MGSSAYLIDKDTVFRHGLKQLLAAKFYTNVVGQHLDIGAAEHEISILRPDLLFVDLGEHLYEGLANLRRLRTNCPRMKVTLLCGSAVANMARETFSCNLDAYVLKPLRLAEFEQLFEKLHDSETYIAADLINYGVAHNDRSNLPRCGYDLINNRLSDRETQILVRTVNGQTATAIAEEFNISVKTAEWHRRNVYSKLHVKNVAQLTKFALRAGIIALD